MLNPRGKLSEIYQDVLEIVYSNMAVVVVTEKGSGSFSGSWTWEDPFYRIIEVATT